MEILLILTVGISVCTALFFVERAAQRELDTFSPINDLFKMVDDDDVSALEFQAQADKVERRQ